MLEQILFIGGEQDGAVNSINETKDKIEIPVRPKLDFRKFFGIVTVDTRPLRTEIYYRKRLGDLECFCLEGMTDGEILAKIPKK